MDSLEFIVVLILVIIFIIYKKANNQIELIEEIIDLLHDIKKNTTSRSPIFKTTKKTITKDFKNV